MKGQLAAAIRDYVVRSYVKPARRRGAKSFKVRAGDVHREMGFRENRMPDVCRALRKKSFLQENRLRIVEQTGPPSGQSSTVTYTYEFADATGAHEEADPFEELRGIFKDVFAALGGGENFIKAERAAFEESLRKEER